MELITLLPFLFAVLSLVFVISAIYGFDAIKTFVLDDKVIDFKIRHFIASSVFPSLGIQDLADSITQEIEAQDCEENC